MLLCIFDTSNTVGREDFDPESADRLLLFEGRALPASVDKKSIDMDPLTSVYIQRSRTIDY